MNFRFLIFDFRLRALAAALLVISAPAAWGQFSTRIQYFTNLSYPYPIVMTNGATIAFGGTNWLPVYRDRGLAIGTLFAGTNSAPSAITNLEVDLSIYDGVNWYSNCSQLVWLPRSQGNAATATWTNFPKTVIDNARRVRIETLRWPLVGTAGAGMNTNTIVITNIVGGSFP